MEDQGHFGVQKFIRILQYCNLYDQLKINPKVEEYVYRLFIVFSATQQHSSVFLNDLRPLSDSVSHW